MSQGALTFDIAHSQNEVAPMPFTGGSNLGGTRNYYVGRQDNTLLWVVIGVAVLLLWRNGRGK